MASIILNQGDSYSATGQGVVAVTVTSAPNLTGNTGLSFVVARGATILFTASGTLAAATYPAAQVVNVPLTRAQTLLLTMKNYTYQLVTTLSNGDTVTLSPESGGQGTLYATPVAGSSG